MAHICPNCIGEPILRSLAITFCSSDYTCDYCESDLPAAELSRIAEKCDEVLTTFYQESSQTMAVVHFGRTPAGEDLATTLQELALVSASAATDIAEILEFMWHDRDSDESKYGEDPWFVLRSSMESPLVTEWAKMEVSLRGEARYLNPKVTAFMESIFGGISHDRTETGVSVLVNAGPGTSYEFLYRARVFQSDYDLWFALQHPEKSLGCPPSGVGSGGRMNAAGLPAFYGATNTETALAEVRPPVGSSVAIAKFSVIRQLNLLNLKLLSQVRLPQSASLFDQNTKFAAQRRDFLRKLSERMTLPVMPENQDHNYLITQVVADYLAMHPGASIDGIIYPSVQVAEGSSDMQSENVVLFHKAATAINSNNIHDTAHAELWEYENDEPGEILHPRILYKEVKPEFVTPQLGFNPMPALQLVGDSIQIHRVLSVKIQTDFTPVLVVNDISA